MIKKTSPEPERYRFANSRFDGETRLGEISRDLLYPDPFIYLGEQTPSPSWPFGSKASQEKADRAVDAYVSRSIPLRQHAARTGFY